jgi:SAM-dependent methyltransferase
MLEQHYRELASRDLDYWWFRVRADWVMRKIRDASPNGPKLLVDVGCGAGGFLAAVLRAGLMPAERLIGLEQHPMAVESARARGVPVQALHQQNWRELPLTEQPDVITLLDVLEHVDKPIDALRDLRAAAAPGAHLVVLVPAMPALWSEWDELLGHYRRYDRPALRADLECAGWEVLELRYLFNALVVPALLRGRLIWTREMLETEFPQVSSCMNAMLSRLFLSETRLPGLPFGTSLGAVARSKSTA